MSQSVFTQSPNRGFEESRCRARNLSGMTPPPPEPEGPWCKTIMAGMTSYGYKPFKSWEQHSDGDDDIDPVQWVMDRWSWLANGGGVYTPEMEPYSDNLYLRATWESTVTNPSGGTSSLKHTIVLNRYSGGYVTDLWQSRAGSGWWVTWVPDYEGETPFDWLYIRMLNDEVGNLGNRTRSVTIGPTEASGTEVYDFDPSDSYPDGVSTTWTASYTMFNPTEDWWSESMVGLNASNMLNSVSWDSVTENTMTVMSMSTAGNWVREDGYPLPFSVGPTFPAGGFNIIAEGGPNYVSGGPVTWGNWGYRKSRVAWPEAEEDVLNSYALMIEQRRFARPATSEWPGPDNSVPPGFDDPTYLVFDASAGMKHTYYYGNQRVHLGSAWAIPSESSAAPPSSSQGPLSTQ